MRWIGLKLFAVCVCVTLLLALPGAKEFLLYRVLGFPMPLYDCVEYVFDHTTSMNRVDMGELPACWAEVRITPLEGYDPGGLTPETVYGSYTEGDDLYLLLRQPGGTVLCKSDLHTGEWIGSVSVESRWRFQVSETAVTVLCPDAIRRFDRALEPLEETALEPGLAEEWGGPPTLGPDGREIYYLDRKGLPVVYQTEDRTRNHNYQILIGWDDALIEVERFLRFGAVDPFGGFCLVFTHWVSIPEDQREKDGPAEELETIFLLDQGKDYVACGMTDLPSQEGELFYLDEENGWFHQILPGGQQIAISETGGNGRFLFGTKDGRTPVVLLDAMNQVYYETDALDSMTEAVPLRVLEARTVLCRLQEGEGDRPYLAAVTFL